MSDDENFLSRWARRKRDVAKEEGARVQPPAPARAPAKEGQPPDPAAPAAKAPELPEFDLSQLPSLDSIGATSDITAFLQPGVPSALKHAALRRAWVADPAIRDFIGPADYAWDFTAPDAMPGFGALGVDDDVQKILADLFRDADAKPEPPRDPPAEAVQPEAESAQPDSPAAEIARAPATPPAVTPSERDNLLHREENIALQQDENSGESVIPPPRRHGGAMPH